VGSEQDFMIEQALALFTATATRLETKLDKGLGDMQREIHALGQETAGVKNTVDLLVAGKLRISGNGGGQHPGSSTTVSLKWLIELGKLAGAFLAGFLGGKGGAP